VFFFSYNLLSSASNVEYLYQGMFTIVLFVIPLLTMKLLSDERRLKTDQALLTSPVSLGGIVLGKFFAALIMFMLGVLITVIYTFIMAVYGHVDWMVMISNLVGMALMGGALIAIGLFISSMTESQIVSAIVSFAVALILYLVDSFSSSVSAEWLKNLLTAVSINTHYVNFNYGLIYLPDVVFFVSVAAVFLFLTIRMIDKRRWS